jgi:hypothetical protein
MENLKEVCEDACTHGLYTSEVEERYRADYIRYLIDNNRHDLIDTK